jgi:hypothetical protein
LLPQSAHEALYAFLIGGHSPGLAHAVDGNIQPALCYINSAYLKAADIYPPYWPILADTGLQPRQLFGLLKGETASLSCGLARPRAVRPIPPIRSMYPLSPPNQDTRTGFSTAVGSALTTRRSVPLPTSVARPGSPKECPAPEVPDLLEPTPSVTRPPVFHHLQVPPQSFLHPSLQSLGRRYRSTLSLSLRQAQGTTWAASQPAGSATVWPLPCHGGPPDAPWP